MFIDYRIFIRILQVALCILHISLNACSKVIDINLEPSDYGVGELIDFKLNELDGELGDSEVDAREVPVGDMMAGEMPAGDMVAGEMMAGEMLAGDMVAGEISAGDMVAGEISAGETCVPMLESCDRLDNDCDGRIDEEIGTELCNGEDDDCDGQVDEDFTELGQECSNGLGECTVTGIMICGSVDMNVTCNGLLVMPSEEICDELDNDCDGVIDEGVMGCCIDGESQLCGSNVGACVQGIQQCRQGEWGSCDGNGPTTEVCDGADNDCDHRIDESVLNACGLCGQLPSETCNGQDDDCDGRTDEQVTNACGECGVLPSEVCDEQDNDCDGRTDEQVTNACGTCDVLPPELCDNQDNDCDGRSDEDLVNGACEAGIGECHRSGFNRCISGQYSCDAVIGLATVEVCDGMDNDCDGRSDEDSQGGNLCNELCDGRDNDLDGQIDEGVLNACDTCGAVPNEICNGQDDDCDGQIDEGVLNACDACGAVPHETCNGQDDDCDGQVDERVLNACGQCGTLPTEVCNTQDDDCDGSVDEGFEQLGTACTIGQGACRSSGIFVCAQDQLSCNAAVIEGGNETCNGLDDDCDGQADEHIDFNRDSNHCGSCGNRCRISSDRCIQGQCVCGQTQSFCTSIEICDGFRCCRNSERCFELP